MLRNEPIIDPHLKPTLDIIAEIDSLIQSNKTTFLENLSNDASTPFNILDNIVKGTGAITSKMTHAITQNPASQAIGSVTNTVINAATKNPVSQATSNAISTVTDLASNNPITKPVKNIATKVVDNTKQLVTQAQIKKINLLKMTLIHDFFAHHFDKNHFDPGIFIAYGFTADKLNSPDMKDINDFFDLVILLNELKSNLEQLSDARINPHKWKIRINELYWPYHNKKNQEIMDHHNKLELASQEFNLSIKKASSVQQDAHVQLLFNLEQERLAFQKKCDENYTETNELSTKLKTIKETLLKTYRELEDQYKDINEKLNLLKNLLSPNLSKLFEKKADWETIEYQHKQLEKEIAIYQDKLHEFQGKLNGYFGKVQTEKNKYQDENAALTAILKKHQSAVESIKSLDFSPLSDELQQKYAYLNKVISAWELEQKNLIKELLPDNLREKIPLIPAINLIQSALTDLLPLLKFIENAKKNTNTPSLDTLLNPYLNSIKIYSHSLTHHIKLFQKHLNELLKNATNIMQIKNLADNEFNLQMKTLSSIQSLSETLNKINYDEYLRHNFFIIILLEKIPFENNLSTKIDGWHDVDKKFRDLQSKQIVNVTPKPLHTTKTSTKPVEKQEFYLPKPLTK